MKPIPINALLGAPPAGDVIDLALSRTKQSVLAAELNWPESKVSEVKTRLKQDGAVFLRALGLKLVPQDVEVYDPAKLDALIAMLKVSLPSLSAKQLSAEN